VCSIDGKRGLADLRLRPFFSGFEKVLADVFVNVQTVNHFVNHI
jgi:hypothetical protein